MSIKRRLVINTSINLAGYIYLLLASFFSIRYLLSNLGPDIFGIFVLLGSVVSIAAVFDLGLSTAVVRKLSIPQTTNEEKEKVWQTSFFLFLILASLVGIISFGLLTYLSRTLQILSILNQNNLFLTSVIIAVTVFINHLEIHLLDIPQAQQRFGIFNSKTFIVGTANTVLSAFLSFYTSNLAAIFGMQLLFHFVTFIFMIIYCSETFKGNKFWPKYHKSVGNELLGYGLKNTVGNIASQIDAQITKFFLGTFASAEAITVFYIPQNIVMKGAGLVSQVAQAVFPFSASLLEKDRIRKLKKLILSLQALVFVGGILAIICTYTIGQPFLMWWLKDEKIVSSAYPVLIILSYYFFMVALTPIPSVLVQGLNKPHVTSFFASLTLVIDAILMFFLVPSGGAIGAAKSILISSSITVPTFMIYTWILMESEIKRLNA